MEGTVLIILRVACEILFVSAGIYASWVLITAAKEALNRRSKP
jgi:hypothetical protein